jgi:hypothetical protein
VRKLVSKAKAGLEKSARGCRVFDLRARDAVCDEGLDSKDRFPKQGFEEVGDFDVLAYWPQGNRWLLGECKYNQPAFCVKDARRLRDRVFGGGSELGQFVEIERRRKFFTTMWTYSAVAALAGASACPDGGDRGHICKDLHRWLRFPPYDVPMRFSQIDALGAWLSANGFPTPVDASPNAHGAREPRPPEPDSE